MSSMVAIALDRTARIPLAAQIHAAIGTAIRDGRLAGGARLPSWRDLAAQLGVARGTVREAYERLGDEQLVLAKGAAGTWVADGIAPMPSRKAAAEVLPLPELYHQFGAAPLPFQMGVPAQDAFPFMLWSRLMARAARKAAAAPVGYPDPRGDPVLRREIAGYLAIARGIRCTPAQVVVTGGFAGALGLAIAALRLHGRTAWLEDPGFPLTRHALAQAEVAIMPVPVDGQGIDVVEGVRRAGKADFAVVTPGQQSPTGVTMALDRRRALLDWARAAGAWIIEDDYLGELQLRGRAAPALASLDQHGRVLHAGTFSKTISPALRLGFLVVPPALAQDFGRAAACLAPAPAAIVQHAVAAFMAEGHHLRHIRRMKRLYAGRREALLRELGRLVDPVRLHAVGGLALRLALPEGCDDTALAARALAAGLAPVPLSPWYASAPRPGLLLVVTNLTPQRLAADCAKLAQLVG